MTSEKIMQFLADRPAISLTAIETEAGIPPRTLYNAKVGYRAIPEKHIPALIKVLERYGWKDNKRT